LPPTHTARDLADAAVGLAGHLADELEEALADHRLTRTSFLVLDALEGSEGHTLGQRELVARVRRTAGNMSVRLGRLEHAGLIERTRDDDDRRNVTVTLTDAGAELARTARATYEQRAERLVAPLGDEAAGLGATLEGWLTFFEPGERHAPRLGIAVAPSAVATRMRRAVGLDAHPGVLVLRVRGGGAADRAGITRGDLITGAAGADVVSVGDLERAVQGANGTLKLSLLRGVEPRELDVELA
jgi:DNA-binding MarR family transcriptional regulator